MFKSSGLSLKAADGGNLNVQSNTVDVASRRIFY